MILRARRWVGLHPPQKWISFVKLVALGHIKPSNVIERLSSFLLSLSITKYLFLVEEDGFGPSKPKQQIYSLPPLTTRELLQIAAIAAFMLCQPVKISSAFANPMELADGLEPPTC